jgi:CPA2 family monovalent cation:H+ antiporter-2
LEGEREFVVNLIVIIAAATGGGVLASFLRLPVILGYLVAGVVVGHYIPGLDIDFEEIRTIAELGVALLLFTLGIQFSPAKLSDIRRVAIIGGLAQIGLTIGLGALIGTSMGLDLDGAVLLGGAVALSSTAVALKLLDARGELDSLHGRTTVGILLVQDLAVVPLVILIPAAAGESGGTLARELGFAAGKAALFLGAAYLLGTFVIPRLLFRVAATGSRELFLLAILSLVLGFAGGSFLLGLSIAFGAFLAGLVVSESEFAYHTLAEVLPLREVFATIFFVSMGILIEPDILLDEPERIAVITVAIVLGKFVLTSGPVTALGLPIRASLLAGVALAQSGEFSFVLAQVGVEEEIISSDWNSTILMAAMLSIFVSSVLVPIAPGILDRAAASSALSGLLAQPAAVNVPDEVHEHIVVCGYGRVGRELVDEVTQRNFRCLVVDQNPYRIEQLKRAGIPCVYGDASHAPVLEACNLPRARLLAVTVPDPAKARLVLTHAKRISPHLDVIVRGIGQDDHEELLAAGAAEVVHPEFEAGLEFVRHALHRYGVDRTQIQALLGRRRRDFYRREP